MKFADLGLSDELLKAVTDAGYDEPTPIQAQAIPSVLMMRDIIGIAQTGTGKTASFVLPMIDVLAHGRARARMPRSLILEPTRELAAQVAENFVKYGVNHKLNMALLIGGVSMGDQIKALEKGVDVLIATPGRLMDLFERGNIMLNGCGLLVIDEADRMLDMGFIPDIEHICTKLPATRQTLLFSATMPPPIKKLADKFLSNPKYIEVARPASANVNIEQALVAVSSRTKQDRLRDLLRQEDVQTGIIFCNRKTTVRDLNKALQRAGYKSGEIHGDMDQSSRLAELELFKSGKVNLLVASDVAARGLDVKGVSHVFNYDAPWHPDDYVHRIGRTGRAGAKGKAYTFVTPADEEAIASIEKLIGTKIPRIGDAAPSEAAAEKAPAGKRERAPRKAKSGQDAPRVEDRVEADEAAPAASPAPAAKRGRWERPAETPAAEAAPRREERQPREDREPREARAPREDREARAPREERQPREERAPREDRQPREPRQSREPRQQREDRAPDPARGSVRDGPQHGVEPVYDAPSKPGEWNGPVPDFLSVAFR